MKRAAAVLMVLFIFLGQANAQSNSWDSLKQLAPGQEVRVVELSMKFHDGKFVSVSDERLFLSTKEESVTCERENILRVSLRKPSHRVRNTLIGAVAGGVAGGFLSNTSTTKAASIPMGAIIGAPLGVAIPTGGSREIYRVW